MAHLQALTEALNKYKLSEAVMVLPRESGKCLVRHKVTNKEFLLGAAEAKVVNSFNDEQQLADGLDEKFVESVVRYLGNKAILIEKEQEYCNSLNVFSQPFGILDCNANFYELKNSDICFVGVPYSKGNHSGGGCDKATNAIRSWMKSRGLHHKSITNGQEDITQFIRSDVPLSFEPLRAKLEAKRLVDIGDFYFYPYEDNSDIFAKLTQLSQHFSERNIAPIYFGGDHSISYPLLKGVSQSKQDFYLIHIDAHTDQYHTQVDELYGRHSVNHHGNFLTKCLDELANLKHVYQFGVRGMNNLGTTKHPKVTSFAIQEVMQILQDQQCEQLLDIPAGANVYLSLDVDVLDPAVFPATNSPVAGGLQYHELLGLLALLLAERHLLAADVVEFNPGIDSNGISHQIFSEILLFIANFVGEQHAVN